MGTSGQRGETIKFSDVLISGYIGSLHDVTAGTMTNSTNGTENESMECEVSDEEVDKRPTPSRRHTPGFVRGLQKTVSVDIIRKGDKSGVDKLAAPEKTDLVHIAEPESILGLERAVVVAIGTTDLRQTYPRHVDPWFDVMARCTSQLVIVEANPLMFRGLDIKPD